MSQRPHDRALRRAVAGALLVLGTTVGRIGAQPLGAPGPGIEGSAVDGESERRIAAALAEVQRLQDEARALESEEQGLGPRRQALAVRARGQIRLLYHLAQGQALAVHGGPGTLLEHAARGGRIREAVRATLREMDAAARRSSTIDVERARNALLLSEAQARHARALALAPRMPSGSLGLAPVDAAIEPGFGIRPAASEAVTVYGGGVAATAPDANNFGDAAGRLLLPVAGRVEVQRARREGTDGPGLEIRAPLGSPVRAVFAGRVAFADRYGAYGRIVILDHGEHYYTVSANLGSMNVRVGEELTTGSVLGTVGDDGRGPMLYFEVRHGSETVDPSPWLGL